MSASSIFLLTLPHPFLSSFPLSVVHSEDANKYAEAEKYEKTANRTCVQFPERILACLFLNEYKGLRLAAQNIRV